MLLSLKIFLYIVRKMFFSMPTPQRVYEELRMQQPKLLVRHSLIVSYPSPENKPCWLVGQLESSQQD